MHLFKKLLLLSFAINMVLLNAKDNPKENSNWIIVESQHCPTTADDQGGIIWHNLSMTAANWRCPSQLPGSLLRIRWMRVTRTAE